MFNTLILLAEGTMLILLFLILFAVVGMAVNVRKCADHLMLLVNAPEEEKRRKARTQDD
jgi:hypothetical protein